MATTQTTFINNIASKNRSTVLQALGYTPENVANKVTDLDGDSDIYYPTQKTVKDALDLKQDKLNYSSILGGFYIEEEDYES